MGKSESIMFEENIIILITIIRMSISILYVPIT